MKEATGFYYVKHGEKNCKIKSSNFLFSTHRHPFIAYLLISSWDVTKREVYLHCNYFRLRLRTLASITYLFRVGSFFCCSRVCNGAEAHNSFETSLRHTCVRYYAANNRHLNPQVRKVRFVKNVTDENFFSTFFDSPGRHLHKILWIMNFKSGSWWVGTSVSFQEDQTWNWGELCCFDSNGNEKRAKMCYIQSELLLRLQRSLDGVMNKDM